MPPTLSQSDAGFPKRTRSRRPLFTILTFFGIISWLSLIAFMRRDEMMDVKSATTEPSAPPTPEVTPLIAEQYGLGEHPALSDMIQLMDLPSTYLPETGKNRHSGRLIIVGDVHGMKEELQALLDKVKFDKKHDHLILAGDMISKGPDSVGVVDLAMELGATGIRGNHEDRILLAAKDMLRAHLDTGAPGPSEDTEKKQDMLEEESFSHGDYKDRKLVKALGHQRIKWLKKCPVILRVGRLGSMGEVVVVHAGLAPGVKLEKQDPSLVMNMRTIGKHGVPSEGRDGTKWRKAWNKFQKKLPKHERTTVIYGHDSHQGLQVEKYSIGVDTGCLRGGKLTAVVIEGGASDHSRKLVHVKCKNGQRK
ncbi:related to Ser/Thr protein phosphatase family [Rhynchosporium agropyri]|uniref:Related to Ser/Thr protein phosphatase family n=1 Tax=Rhynchosporium agropyri TaxID=914238 RepID=A0A1E1L4M5_9HELO|nr:related to Ser/Thr protein phosphatase family [Rhynchosporium agropyri]